MKLKKPTETEHTWQHLADMVKACQNETDPLLSKSDFDAIASIAGFAMQMLWQHRTASAKEGFRKAHPKVYKRLESAVGKMVKVTDVNLRTEVGAKAYDDARGMFYVQKIKFDPIMYMTVELCGCFAWYDTKGRLNTEREDGYEVYVSDLERGIWTIVIDKKHADLIPKCAKDYPPLGLMI